MDVDTSLLSILIPVFISIVGLIPAVLAYLNSKPTDALKKKQLAEAMKTDAEADKMRIDSMSSIMEAANNLLVIPLKDRVAELERENELLKTKLEKDEEDRSRLLERIARLEEENTNMQAEFTRTHADLCAALNALEECRADLHRRLSSLEEQAGQSVMKE